MENVTPSDTNNKGKIPLIILIVLGIILSLLFYRTYSGKGSLFSSVEQKTASDLISTKEIALLSVSEFVYNGIAQTYKENGDHDYNVLYKSTVKVSVDADSIDYIVDEEKKLVTFIFPEFQIAKPVVDIGSISFIPNQRNLYMDEVVKLCRTDALTEAEESEKLIISAQENLQSIMEAWYAPVMKGYSFDFQFGNEKGGEAK